MSTATKVEENPTYNINEVEVFSAGTWNKDTYTINDLYDMVTAFNTLKEGFRPYLKLGHDDAQKLAKSSGLPSLGWVDKLYVKGQKLYADFSYIPKKIFDLIKTRAYRKVSCEIYWNLDVNGNKYPRVLGAIALLGSETPGVLNLQDILANYSMSDLDNMLRVFKEQENQDSFKTYDINFEPIMEDNQMSQEIEAVQAELEEQKKSYAKAQEELEAKNKEIESRDAELIKYREEALKAQEEARIAKVAKFVSELESQKLSTPAMKDLLTELMSDKKEYTVKEKNVSKEEIIKDLLTLSQEAAKVNFDENSRAEFAKSEDKQKAMDEKIQKYMKDKGCSYGQAMKAVSKGMNDVMSSDDEDKEK